MITTKEIAEKIHMFYNLLFHLDDYIKNKKERKGQLRVSKNIRLILREIISSTKNLNYFMNKKELDAYKDLSLKTNDEILEKEKKYILKINPLSFNQKNLNTINLFFDSGSEVYILNYLTLDKIFSIIRFCFKETINKKNTEFIEKLEKKYKNDFILYHIDDEKNNNKKDNNETNNLNNIVKNNQISGINSYKNKGRYVNIKTSKNRELTNSFKNNNFNLSILLNNNSFNLNNILNSPNNNSFKNSNNSLNDLRIQINKLNNQMNLTSMKNNAKRISYKNNLKKNISLPLIKENKKLYLNSNDKNKLNKNESIKSNNKIDLSKDYQNQNNKFNFLFNISKQINNKRSSFSNDKNIKLFVNKNLSSKFIYKKILSLYNLPKKFSVKKGQ